MKITLAAVVLLLTASIPGGVSAASGAEIRASGEANAQAPAGLPSASPKAPGDAATDNQDAYYYFMVGHLAEQDYEASNGAMPADPSIQAYKKALELDPGSPVILERLAEIYAKSNQTREAVESAREALKGDPKSIDAHRLLAFIYYRALGDQNAAAEQQENLENAVEQFKAILDSDPRDLNASLMLARLYGFENKHEDAEKILRAVLARNSENGPALEQLSQLLLDQNRSQEAIDLLKQAADDSADPGIYDLLGDAYSQNKDYPNAESAYRKAVDGDPDDPGHLHGLADALLAQDKYADALVQYMKLVKIEPSSSNNYLRMAELYRRLGQYTESRSNLERAKELAPGNLEILFSEALLDEDQGHADDAVKLLSSAISVVKTQSGGENTSALTVLYEQLGHAYESQQDFPDAVTAYRNMADSRNPDARKRGEMLVIEAYRENHDIDHAIGEAKTDLVQMPGDRELTTTLALLYGDKNQTPDGLKLLEALLHGTDQDQEIYIDIAQVEERGRQFAEAEQSAEKAVQMAKDPSASESAHFMLGVTYERQKKFDLAEQEFRKVLDGNPNNVAVLNYYGYMLANRGMRLDEATAMIQKAVDAEPSNAAYLDSLGWAYYKQDKLPQAEEYLQRAVGLEGHDPTILSHLGDVYLKTGQNERAADLFERSVAEWQKALPSDYEADKADETEAKLRTLKKRLAQKTSPPADKPQ